MPRLGILFIALTMMNSNLAARETDTNTVQFTTYPAFYKNRARVEAVIDKGLMQEIIIRCFASTGIVTFSKAERVYCTPDHQCFDQFKTAVGRLC